MNKKMAKVNPTTSIIIFKCEWSKHPNQKIEITRQDIKAKSNYILSNSNSH